MKMEVDLQRSWSDTRSNVSQEKAEIRKSIQGGSSVARVIFDSLCTIQRKRPGSDLTSKFTDICPALSGAKNFCRPRY